MSRSVKGERTGRNTGIYFGEEMPEGIEGTLCVYLIEIGI